MYSIEDFEAIIKFLNLYSINYESGSYYNNNDDVPTGYWVKILDTEIVTLDIPEDEE